MVRYTLRSIDKCGLQECAAITAEGSEQTPNEGSTTEAGTFRGEQDVLLPSAVPVSKSIESTTHLHTEQSGDSVEYVNVIRVHVQRVDH